ncbi:MAG TPA: histidine kinase, partial [Ilumatobacteraceae bacterium]
DRRDVNSRDVVVAVVLLAVMIASIHGKVPGAGQRGADALAYALAVPLTLPFAVHRRWPVATLAATVAAFLAFATIGYAAYPGVSLFAILFGIAAHTDRRRSVAALAVCVTAMVAGLSIQPVGIVTTADRTSSLLAIAVAWLAGENLRSRRARWAALEDRATMLENEREERDRRAVADERLRIARDLHDIVSHTMSVIAVQAGAGHHLIDSDPEAARRALSNVETASRGALVEMRRMLGVLRDDDDAPGTRAPAPGLSKIGDLVGRVRDSGLGVSLEMSDPIPDRPASVDLAAYRIVQESLTNVMKHGGPIAFVSIGCTATDLSIEVADNGRQREADRSSRRDEGGLNAGQGLIGMRERVAVYGGELAAGPTPDGGFRVTVRLPLGGDPSTTGDRTASSGTRS